MAKEPKEYEANSRNTSMNNDLQELIGFILEKAELEPIGRRAIIYRALAVICGDPLWQQHLSAVAKDLERAAKNLSSLQLQFNSEKISNDGDGQ